MSRNQNDFSIRVLTKDDAEEYNALLRYAFQVTEAELAETGWKDDEIKQSKFPVLERADVLGCFNGDELVSQFAVYPLDINIYGQKYVTWYHEKTHEKKSYENEAEQQIICSFIPVFHTIIQKARLGDHIKQNDICRKRHADPDKDQ